MGDWKYIYANNPFDDYNLVVELEYNDLQVGYIKRSRSGLNLVLHPNFEELNIPLDWLSEIIEKAKTDLK